MRLNPNQILNSSFMNLRELVPQIVAWNNAQGGSGSMKGNPEEEYRAHVERAFLKKGKVLLSRYDELQKAMDALEAEQQALKTELREFEKEMLHTAELPSGERVSVDLSQRPGVQAFWQEVKGVVSGNTLPDLDRMLGGMGMAPAVEKLYDSSFLAQESDDLLRYL